MSSLDDSKEQSSANVASSANGLLLNSLTNNGIPLKSAFSLIASAHSLMHIINR